MDMLNTPTSRASIMLLLALNLLAVILGCQKYAADKNYLPIDVKIELQNAYAKILLTLENYDEDNPYDPVWQVASDFASKIDASARNYCLRHNDLLEIMGREADLSSPSCGTIEYLLKDSDEFPLILMLDVDDWDTNIILRATIPFVQY